jgi:hypothetical protein
MVRIDGVADPGSHALWRACGASVGNAQRTALHEWCESAGGFDAGLCEPRQARAVADDAGHARSQARRWKQASELASSQPLASGATGHMATGTEAGNRSARKVAQATMRAPAKESANNSGS